ncbi:hypothetical protein SDRG_03567 [Saprolegnia diclina VS20]|uniref:Pentacotripeptide-repeat region of PRORP domain-containing protein n=1 Tax=Saprolegnia diclina (strain VS20) TaxID=1156394 RepID=T0QMP2_SAPDV|nr:hypothetical protein SDRG_03567 [Saprolegnia diclina VS20]EQC39364.1 hypothetical protein SDRG_03567 [Saprolegnia diclina VS20]|eukprot:XP_008607425.1 hypothetical protein SDRG_03567 [Saprolegnia diclina VS20]
MWPMASRSVRQQNHSFSTLPALSSIMFRHVARSLQRAASLRVAAASPAMHMAPFQLPATRYFATPPSQRAPTKMLSVLEVKQLGQSTKQEILKKHGSAGFFSRAKQVRHTWTEFCASTPAPSSMDLQMFFAAAKATEADYVIIESLLQLRANYPKDVKIKHYIESKVAFLRSKRLEAMLEIFEDERASHSHPQAIFYVWALSALNDLGQFDRAHALLVEMRHAGYMVPNDTVTRIMYNLALANDKEGVLALYELVDATMGIWTPVALNRLMTSLGRVGCPEEAFQFYSLSTMELDPSTFRTLLEICVRNKCLKETADVLKNRSLFNITLDASGYNTILEALLILDRVDEIGDILNEMAEHGIKSDSKTEFILRRCQYASRATPHSKPSMTNAFNSTGLKDPSATQLDLFLHHEDYASASTLASELLTEQKTPLHMQTLDAVMRAFIYAGDDHKVDALLAHLTTSTWSSSGVALQTAMRHYANRVADKTGKFMIADPDRAMAAYKAARFQGVPMLSPGRMFPVFLYVCDADAAIYELQTYMEYHLRDPMKARQMRETVFFDTLRVCIKAQRYDDYDKLIKSIVDAQYMLSPKAFHSFWFDPTKYSLFQRGMPHLSEKQKHDQLLRLGKSLNASLRLLMDKQHFEPTYEMIDAVANTLYYSGYRSTLAQLYLKASKCDHDVLPEQTYGKILDVLVVGKRVPHAQALYAEANARLSHVNQPWLLAAPIAQGLADAGKYDALFAHIDAHPYPSVFRSALLALYPRAPLAVVRDVLDKMLAADLVPNMQLVQRAMLAAVKAGEKKNQVREIPGFVNAFLSPLEARLVVDDVVQPTLSLTNSSGLTSTTDVDVRELKRTYGFAQKALAMTQDDSAIAAHADKMRRWSLAPKSTN